MVRSELNDSPIPIAQMQKTITSVCALLVVCIIPFLSGCVEQPANIDVEFRIPVEVVEIQSGDIENLIRATGTLRTTEIATVRNQVPGYLYIKRDEAGQRLVEGSRVKAGETIAETTGEDARLFAGIESNRAALETATAELERRSEMYKNNLIAETDLRSQEVTHQNALFAYEQSVLKAQQANHTAPIDGVILSLARDDTGRPVADGQLIAPGFEVAEIAPVETLIADIDLIGAEISRIKVGQETRIRHNAYENLRFPGRVLRLSPKIDPNTRTFRAEINVENYNRRLLPGMFVEVLVVVEKRSNVPVVPRQSVTRRGGNHVVFIVDGQRVSERIVTLGLSDASNHEIIEGLSIGDRVVYQGLETLTDGTRIRVIGN